MRVFHDLKQVELAEKLGVSKSYVSEIEKGNRTPSLDVLQSYASAFDVPLSSILFFSEKLGSNDAASSPADKAQHAIATKVIRFLQIIEDRTAEQ